MRHRFSPNQPPRQQPLLGQLYVRTMFPWEELSYADRLNASSWDFFNCARKRGSERPVPGYGAGVDTSAWPGDWAMGESITYRYASDADLRIFASAFSLADLYGSRFPRLDPVELIRLRDIVEDARSGGG